MGEIEFKGACRAIASLHQPMGNFEEAIPLFKDAVATKTEPSPACEVRLARALNKLGKVKQAAHHLKTAQQAWVSAHPEFPPALEAKAFASEIN